MNIFASKILQDIHQLQMLSSSAVMVQRLALQVVVAAPAVRIWVTAVFDIYQSSLGCAVRIVYHIPCELDFNISTISIKFGWEG